METLAQQLSHLQDGTEPAALFPAAASDTIDGIMPRWVVTAHTTQQVSLVAKFASEHGLLVAPRGGASQMQWGGLLEHIDIVLDMSAMNRVIDYQPADMTITVEAGCTLHDLQQILADQRQFLPIDPALPSRATLGGIVATNATGPLRLAYGTVRDYLIGARVVRATGEITKAGGRVVKNAAGYELCKLYTGSMGSLGILTELTFMVRPLPEARNALFVPLSRLEVAEPVIGALLSAALEPAFLELANQEALRHFAPEALGETDVAGFGGLFIGFAGSSAAVDWQVQLTIDIVADLPTRAGQELRALPVPWNAVHESLLKGRMPSSEALVCRASLLSSAVAAFIAESEAYMGTHGINPHIMAHAGSGVVHIVFDPIPTESKRIVSDLLKAASAVPVAPALPMHTGKAAAATDSTLAMQGLGDLEELRRLSAGNLVIESGPAEVRRELPVWGRQRSNHVLMQEIKRRLDPGLVLNKGRMVGG